MNKNLPLHCCLFLDLLTCYFEKQQTVSIMNLVRRLLVVGMPSIAKVDLSLTDHLPGCSPGAAGCTRDQLQCEGALEQCPEEEVRPMLEPSSTGIAATVGRSTGTWGYYLLLTGSKQALPAISVCLNGWIGCLLGIQLKNHGSTGFQVLTHMMLECCGTQNFSLKGPGRGSFASKKTTEKLSSLQDVGFPLHSSDFTSCLTRGGVITACLLLDVYICVSFCKL